MCFCEMGLFFRVLSGFLGIRIVVLGSVIFLLNIKFFDTLELYNVLM